MKIFDFIKKIIFPVDVVEETTKKLEKYTAKELAALNKKTKVEIEKAGRKIGVELDRRKTKAKLLAELKKHNRNIK